MQSIHPHPISRWFILILSSHLCLGFPSGLLQDSPPKSSHLSPQTHKRFMPCLFHSGFYHPNDSVWAVQSIHLLIMAHSSMFPMFSCHSESVTWQHYFGWRFCTFFHTLWTVLCSRSLVTHIETFMTFVQEIHGSKHHWDFRSFCCRCMQLLVQCSAVQYSTVQDSTI